MSLFQIDSAARLLIAFSMLLGGCTKSASDAAPPPAPPIENATESQSQLTSAQITELNQTIVKCVQYVRSYAASANPYERDFFANFDAYYNAGMGRVLNNGGVVGSRKAEFAFNKCMASLGWPLS